MTRVDIMGGLFSNRSIHSGDSLLESHEQEVCLLDARAINYVYVERERWRNFE